MALFHLEDFRAAKQAFSDALQLDSEYKFSFTCLHVYLSTRRCTKSSLRFLAGATVCMTVLQV